MSNEDNKSWGVNTVMTAVGMLSTIVCTVLMVFMKLQLENIALQQQNSSLIILSTVNEKYVSKVELLAMTDSLSRLTSMSLENNTAIKLIQNQLAKQYNNRVN